MNEFSTKYGLMVRLFKSGDFTGALDVSESLLAIDPNSIPILKITGACHYGLLNKSRALEAFQRIIDIDPLNVDAYFNKGVLLQELSSWNAADECYQNVLKIDPSNYKALNNTGIILSVRRDYSAAFQKFREAILIKNDFVNAICNAGLAKQNLGDFESAIKFFEQALQKEPENYLATHCMLEVANLVELSSDCTSYVLDLDYQLRKIIESKSEFSQLYPESLIEVISLSQRFLEENSFDFQSQLTQIFINTGADLGCTKHKNLFFEKKIISNACFGCFKVEISIETVIGLIELAVLFYKLELPENVIVKTFIETREFVNGSYKGLIYCNSYEQSLHVAGVMNDLVCRLNYNDWKISIKRGCSEYYEKFPNFSVADPEDPKFFEIPDEWEAIESSYTFNKMLGMNEKWPTYPKTSLSDFLVMRNWIDFAKGFDDPTSRYFSELEIRNMELFKFGQERSNLLITQRLS